MELRAPQLPYRQAWLPKYRNLAYLRLATFGTTLFRQARILVPTPYREFYRSDRKEPECPVNITSKHDICRRSP